ncbi:MAG: molybdopterin oxidoreductase family protein [Desulfobulbus sp.]|nr:molybdopterin oxidoreductase family protein [Desulfobulbus sp.]
MTIIRSVCPYDCPDTCGLLVTIEDNRVVRVVGDPEHPITRGFLCPKMTHYEQTVHSPRRLTTPLLRIGPKGSGSFAPISWAEAVGRICERWQGLMSEFGGESILPYSYAGTMGMVQRNAGHPFFHYLGASRLDRTICAPAKDAGWKMIMGETAAMQPSEMLASDLIILWGLNAAATSIHAMRDALNARKKGAKLWVIDTYHTPTAEAADEVFLVKPGMDGGLALAMMHVLVRDRLVDMTFIRDNIFGFEEFAQTVLPQYSPQAMAERCGLSEAVIERMARSYAQAQAPFIRLGSGLTRYGNGAMTVRTITCLPALVGAWQRTGGGIFLSTSTGSAFPLSKVTREDFCRQPTRLVNMNQLGDALTTLSDPPIKSLYVYHSNPAAIAPDQGAVVRGLLREDLFTVVHERFLTDTARYADIVLPATTSLEHEDLYRAYGSYSVQVARAVIPPVGEAKSNWEVFQLLARGMGWNEPFFAQTGSEMISQLLFEKNFWRDTVTNSRLQGGEPVLLQVPNEAKQNWKTPSGRIEIKNERETEPFPRLLPTHAEEDGFPLRLQSAPNRYALNSSFYERDDLRQKQDCMQLLMHPEDAIQRSLNNGQVVLASNDLGQVQFSLKITERTPPGTVVSEGVWWREFVPGEYGINALMSQRLTDSGRGSTLYDVTIEVRGM